MIQQAVRPHDQALLAKVAVSRPNTSGASNEAIVASPNPSLCFLNSYEKPYYTAFKSHQ